MTTNRLIVVSRNSTNEMLCLDLTHYMYRGPFHSSNPYLRSSATDYDRL